MSKESSFIVEAPGRVFIFGEHSDYLGLEVISMALDKTIKIKVKPRKDSLLKINYADFNEEDSFSLDENVVYRHKRDYLRSCFNVLKRDGFLLKTGADLIVTGEVPIAAGLSSSSAFSIACVMTFARLAEKELTTEEIVQYAFKGEVVEFGESGGMMDHYSSAFGGIIHVDFGQEITLTKVPTKLTGLVIGDSLEKKKDTVGDLRRIRNTVEEGYRQLGTMIKNFSHRETSLETIIKFIDKVSEENRLMTITTIRNRDLTRKALKVLQQGNFTHEQIGSMIDELHTLIRDGFKRSTPKIERMITAAKSAGALGCKLNGSGGGGTMLAYAPGKEEAVVKAINDAGGKAFIISTGLGAKFSI